MTGVGRALYVMNHLSFPIGVWVRDTPLKLEAVA